MRHITENACEIDPLQFLFELLGTKAFLPSGTAVRLLSKYVCDQTKWEADICENIFFLLSGADPVNFNEVCTHH